MEKQGVIKPGVTPPEKPVEMPAAQKQAAAIAALDDDFRKRAAETICSSVK